MEQVPRIAGRRRLSTGEFLPRAERPRPARVGRRLSEWNVLATKSGWRNWHPIAMRLGVG